MTSAAFRRDREGHGRVSLVFLGIAAVTAVTGGAVWTGFAALPGLAVFLFVTSAWIVSLCLHEYAHARTALHGGDLTVGAKGYLTLNPLTYTHPLLSIVLPVVFVIMGVSACRAARSSSSGTGSAAAGSTARCRRRGPR